MNGSAITHCSVSSCSAELRRVEPDVIMKLHLRAADWYEANGSGDGRSSTCCTRPSGTDASRLVAELTSPDLSGRADVDRTAVARGRR